MAVQRWRCPGCNEAFDVPVGKVPALCDSCQALIDAVGTHSGDGREAASTPPPGGDTTSAPPLQPNEPTEAPKPAVGLVNRPSPPPLPPLPPIRGHDDLSIATSDQQLRRTSSEQQPDIALMLIAAAGIAFSILLSALALLRSGAGTNRQVPLSQSDLQEEIEALRDEVDQLRADLRQLRSAATARSRGTSSNLRRRQQMQAPSRGALHSMGAGFRYKNVSFKRNGVVPGVTVIGEIVNGSGRGYEMATFTISLYDGNGRLLATAPIYVENFASGQTKSFETLILDADASRIKQFKIDFDSGL